MIQKLDTNTVPLGIAIDRNPLDLPIRVYPYLVLGKSIAGGCWANKPILTGSESYDTTDAAITRHPKADKRPPMLQNRDHSAEGVPRTAGN
jgi:hypothetical protein